MKLMPACYLAKPCLKQSFKVAFVEAQSEVCNNWIKLINRFPDFTCCCVCATGEKALLAIPQAKPDVILMDICMPDISGVECIARLKAMLPDIPVVIFTAVNDQTLVLRALGAGADGYLLKRIEPIDLRLALLEVLKGGVPMSRSIARCVVESFRRPTKRPDEIKRLSLREEWALRLLCKGYSNSIIAGKLDLSIYAVRTHLTDLFKKLQVSSRAEAVARYLDAKTPQPKPEELYFANQINTDRQNGVGLRVVRL